jgi:hypothetical protein|tara:strand:- start:223 stop:597 length:375 start_codon:yes stop_codon:yes gene_type:complete
MFNFFKKDKEETQEVEEQVADGKEISVDVDDICAAITYYMTKQGTPFVDIQIADTDIETSLFMSELLKGIYSNEYFPETLEMIKDGFIEQGKAELYIAVAARLGSILTSSSDEKPCISPSDIFD